MTNNINNSDIDLFIKKNIYIFTNLYNDQNPIYIYIYI